MELGHIPYLVKISFFFFCKVRFSLEEKSRDVRKVSHVPQMQPSSTVNKELMNRRHEAGQRGEMLCNLARA